MLIKNIIKTDTQKSWNIIFVLENNNLWKISYSLEDKYSTFVNWIKNKDYAFLYVEYLCSISIKSDELSYADWKKKYI